MDRNYCCYLKDQDLHNKSSSGGFCASVAKYVLDNNGIVYGARFNNDYSKIYFDYVTNINDYYKYLAGSKYGYTFLPKFWIIKNQLESGIKVLFTGCPCHVNSLKKYLNKEYDNLITISLFCQGYCDYKTYKEFIQKCYNLSNKKIKNISFRYSKNNIHYKNGKIVYNDNTSKYVDIWNGDAIMNIQRNTCKKCNIKFNASKQTSDFYTGDFWDYKSHTHQLPQEYDQQYGINNLKILTQKGLDIWNIIKKDFNYLRIKSDWKNKTIEILQDD